MNNDLISREALKEQINDVVAKDGDDFSNDLLVGLDMAFQIIDNAPTVEERPIRCKDCKHTVLSEDGKTLICCLTMKVGTVRPNFYCGNGEIKDSASDSETNYYGVSTALLSQPSAERPQSKCENCDFRKFSETFVDGIVYLMNNNDITSIEQLSELLKGGSK